MTATDVRRVRAADLRAGDYSPEIIARFWSRVNKTETCWLWDKAGWKGYGFFKATKTVRAHRFAYELLVGPIPEGLTLDHRCHNDDQSCRGGSTCPHRRCVKAIADEYGPAHLEPATRGDNTLRSHWQPAALNARKTHCSNGHPLVDGAVYRAGTRRQCKTCHQQHTNSNRKQRNELLRNAGHTTKCRPGRCSRTCKVQQPYGSVAHLRDIVLASRLGWRALDG